MADGGRVPWAGDSEPRDENVRSPKPLLSTSSSVTTVTGGADAEVGEGLARDDLVLRGVTVAFADVLADRTLAGDAEAMADGNAPVIIRSASSTGSRVF